MKKWIIFIGIGLSVAVHADKVLVLAAASTTDAMKETAALFNKQTGHTIQYSFASSGALARQIQSGVQVDLFLSANKKWMDTLEKDGLIDLETRSNLMKNRLVMIAPLGQPPHKIGRLAVGDIRSVPAGMYAREALEHSGEFEQLRPKMVMAANVRAALMFVERGEVDAGIVYATDAKASSRVEIVSMYPEESHSPICYPAAVCRSAKHLDAAKEFLEFLKSSDGMKIFEKYGFNR